MHDKAPLLDRLRTPLVVVAAGAILVTACSSQSGENPGPSVVTSVTSEAAPTPSEITSAPSAINPYGAMEHAQNGQLRQLATYESALQHRFGSEMYFTDMPRTVEESKAQAADMAQTLKEFSKYGVKPLIIMEPMNNDGGTIDLHTLHTPEYATVIKSLFTELKDQGITGREVGELVVLPEQDLPSWGSHSTDPGLFGKNFAVIGGAFKEVFPDGLLSVLINSAAFPSNDVKYMHGSTSKAALMPYIDALKATPGVPDIDTVWFQGFPWSVADKPQDYLNSEIAVALAAKLGVHSVGFNTGTANSYKGKPVPGFIRSAQLLGPQGVLAQAEATERAGFVTTINIFAGKDTDVDWQYKVATNGHSVALPLSDFAKATGAADINFELFVPES